MQTVFRPSGYTGVTQRLESLSDSVAITAYLWGGGGGGGGGGTSGRSGGNGAGGSYSQVTFTLAAGDILEIAVGGGGGGGRVATGSSNPSPGGFAGAGYVVGSTSFSGGAGGYGFNGGGGGGSGGATVLLVNGIVLAVAAGGAGGGGRAAINGNPVTAPGNTGTGGAGVFAGQNGQNMPASGGGGGAGGGGNRGGNGGAAAANGGDGGAGTNGISFSQSGTTTASSGRIPGSTSQAFYDGISGYGGFGGLPGADGTPGGTGYIVLEFGPLPGFFVKFDGTWQFIKKQWVKQQGVWRPVRDTYIRNNGQWFPTLASVAPLLLAVQGKFGVQPRPYQDPVPQITSVTWTPASVQLGGTSKLTWQTQFANLVDYVVDFAAAPPPPPPPSVPITGTFTGPRLVSGQDQVQLCVTGPGPGVYNYEITSSAAVSFDSRVGSQIGVINWEASPQPIFTSGQQNFAFTGNSQTWTVPNGVTSLTIDIRGGGGGGGGSNGSNYGTGFQGSAGKRVQGTISVTAGDIMTIYVGGGGVGGLQAKNASGGGAGGVSYPGYSGGKGGNAGTVGLSGGGGGGGGATVLLKNGNITAIAGGGGGGGGGGLHDALGIIVDSTVIGTQGQPGIDKIGDGGGPGGGGGGQRGGTAGIGEPGDTGASSGSPGTNFAPSGTSGLSDGAGGGSGGTKAGSNGLNGQNGSVGFSWTAATTPPPLTCIQTALITPHPATTLTARITRDGNFTPYQATLSIPARASPSGTQQFTTPNESGNWTVPDGVTKIRVTLIGGGGGGGGGSEGNPRLSGGAGGGSGGTEFATLSVTPGQTIAYKVGAGGIGCSNYGVAGKRLPGTNGGDTTFGTAKALGGLTPVNQGNNHYDKAPPAVAGGGAGTNGQSRNADNGSGNEMSGGNGGSTPGYGTNGGVGAQGGRGFGPINGQDGGFPGGGGGGGNGGQNDATNGAGGNGAGGAIYIVWGPDIT